MTTKSEKPQTARTEAEELAAQSPATDTDTLRKELAEQKDLYLRQAADFDNFKRRSREESAARAAAQKESFMKELLPVIDNLERALASGAVADVSPLHEGVKMTLQQLHLLLRQHGVEPEESLGQVFDAHRHEAISQNHDPAQPAHSILKVFQRGYRKSGQVFRPAKVIVNKVDEHEPGHPKTVHHAR
jgi:molecular chaperone GrpE